MASAIVPVIKTKAKLGDVVSLEAGDALMDLPELFDIRRVKDHASGDALAHNNDVLAQYYDAASCALGMSKRGKPSAAAKFQKKAMEDAKAKCTSQAAAWGSILASVAEGGSADRGAEVCSRRVSYAFKAAFRSRRYARGVAYQTMPRKLRRWAGPTYVQDWDIEASQFTILSWLVRKLEPCLGTGVVDFPFIHNYAADPTGVKQKYAGVLGVDCKQK
eukprot:5947138-Alexandrium_andersonii.AAC.1